jgi:acyl-CoA hydrolase
LVSLTLSEAISLVPPNSRVFVQGGAATPNALLRELVAQSDRLKELTLIHLHTEGPTPYLAQAANQFRVKNLFVGHGLRSFLDYDRIDYLPCFLSEIPALFRSGACGLDVALLHVSPPDRFGYCSLGVSVDVAKAAAESAEILIAQVNPRMPRVHGDGILPMDLFDAMVEVDEELPVGKRGDPTPEEKKIARFVSELVEDGSTLQMGIGSIPDAVARELVGKKDLGLHTEMWSDGALSLLKAGVITNARKKVHRGRCVSGFLLGSRELYDFVNDNPSVIQLEIDYVNSPSTIARNPKVVAINSAVEIDLTGQVCADSVGHRILSGVGGQMDFMRGAALSPGGKPIIALASQTKTGASKIVSSLRAGAGVVTTRAHVHYVVTEYGTALLYGKTIGERARAMIEISHPDHRERLEREFWESHKKVAGC